MPGETEVDLLALTRVPWTWEWVPSAREPAAQREAWAAHVGELFAEWAEQGLAATRERWPAEAGDFPLSGEHVGSGTAEWLQERADTLAPWARLAWGAGFVDSQAPRWAPVPVVVEFFEPLANDPTYLMDAIGTGGLPGDAREPVVDYFGTAQGDAVRAFALTGGPDQAACGRLDAAMRVEWPASDDRPAATFDVVARTRVFDLSLMAAIGPGVEQLLELVAADRQGVNGPDATDGASTGAKEQDA
ncbi:hypothetical protein JQN72_17645 [Phycicoccus sp. CSK15P-2]|uniref:hypothetical protein n=1 Tax=Phycicoccus sp. CSK15P-2 TaxID=2807627 RepID=UPI00194F78E0|nr:hypothetical protein [Phycicoccus sp. CSK15P-2]MBM6406064.1 hypothetical protein [Phycicoccus sp. CSK15P-2]